MKLDLYNNRSKDRRERNVAEKIFSVLKFVVAVGKKCTEFA